MKKKMLLIPLALLLAISLVDIGRPASAEPIKLGLLFPLTGLYSMDAANQREGALLAIKEVNEAGGVLGRRVKAIVRDTELKAEIAMRRAKTLVEVNKVDALGGVLHAGIAGVMSDWASKRKILNMIMCVSTKAMFKKKELTVFKRGSTGNSMYLWASVGSEFGMKDMGWKNYYLFGADYAFGWDLDEAWRLALKKRGANIVASGVFAPLGTTEFAPYIAKIKAAKPDVVIVSNFGGDCINFLKAAKAYGLKAKIMVASLTLTQALGAGPAAVEGVYTLMPLYWESDIPSVRKFSRIYQDEWGRVPDIYSMYGYLAAKELLRAFKGAGTTDAKKAGEYLEANPNLMSPTGPQRWMPYHLLMRNLFIAVGKAPAEVKEVYDMFKVIDVRGFTEDERYAQLPTEIARELGW